MNRNFVSLAGDAQQAKTDMSDQDTILGEHIDSEYKYGFSTDIETDTAAIGLSEDTVRFISAKKNEPEWMLEWRLTA